MIFVMDAANLIQTCKTLVQTIRTCRILPETTTTTTLDEDGIIRIVTTNSHGTITSATIINVTIPLNMKILAMTCSLNMILMMMVEYVPWTWTTSNSNDLPPLNEIISAVPEDVLNAIVPDILLSTVQPT